jgi:hypothetical protein
LNPDAEEQIEVVFNGYPHTKETDVDDHPVFQALDYEDIICEAMNRVAERIALRQSGGLE